MSAPAAISSSELPLAIDGLTKRYRKLVAVDDVSLTIEPGQFVGLIGPNGAGKSTMMGCVAGLLSADEGQITVAGVNVAEQPVDARRHVAFVPQELDLFEYLTGEEFLRFVADVRNVEASQIDAIVEDLLELTELTAARNRVVKEYSGGMRRKLALVSALLGPPDILLLDEAFVGLDPESTWRIRQRLASFCDDGGAIVLSSHALEMLQEVSTRVLVMQDGALIRDISREDLMASIDSGEHANLTEYYLAATGKGEPGQTVTA